MEVPCSKCLVRVRCIQKVIVSSYNTIHFNVLLRECEDLRKFFNVNTITHRIRIKKGYNLYPILDPGLISTFTKVMIKKVPKSSINIKKSGKNIFVLQKKGIKNG